MDTPMLTDHEKKLNLSSLSEHWMRVREIVKSDDQQRESRGSVLSARIDDDADNNVSLLLSLMVLFIVIMKLRMMMIIHKLV